MSLDRSDMGRRDFFRRAGAGAAVVGLGLAAREASAKKIARVDPHSPKTGGLLKEGEVIGIGMIGVGGMGSGHVGELLDREKGGEKQQIRAISDCYMRRNKLSQKRVKETVGRDVEYHFDYKQLLERDDIHAVVVATPDHWHAQISMDAMRAGKDVYCQKPVTLTVPESVEVRNVCYETGRVFQCGSQFCSQDFYWQAKKFIEKGGIGKVLWAQADYSRNSADGPNGRGGEWNYHIDSDASPDKSAGDGYIDWTQWLGPAKKRAFSKARFFQFRKYWDYSGGIATDLLYHYIAPLTIALGVSAPERACGAGGIFVQNDDREVPDTFMVTLDYPEDVTLVLTSSMANRQANPLMIRGHKATIRPHKDGMQVTAENEFKEWFTKEFGAEEIIVKNEAREDHMTNFLNACRSRGATHCDAETAYRAMAATKMGCESWRQDKILFWDSEKERHVNKHPRPNRKSRWPQEPEPVA
ncbi:MAG: Gfo/Idh/MocA family oxidoreductase [Candidatus Hydrogenedentes bacterium]|nr:Gfo/Idh/MocA family oxidoreductase [Candidatus Hydrogenedentota bacterium]